ncbi:urea ABC transporter ATP-binding subunit UrtE [Mitsuokella multacida]|uniref:urea ABC transporter ATP-binding subunit UrtE n=1 Tax=Mitsuokella multacida TaxID=52226 RepID=UPI00241CA099|nr:urea ABC transporter ATP-binding subunit UrtE [Mitsuokella multacida]
MLEIKGLTAYYGESEILHDINLSVPDGKIIALVGRNGVGKTTTLKSIMGVVKTPAGSIELSGEELLKKPPYERARCGIGYVPQGRDIFPQMTVAENLRLGLEVCGGKKQDPSELFHLFPIVEKFLPRKGGDLSGGQQQQLAIARALIAHPKLLLLDEPTEGIQPSVIQEIGAAIRTINKETGLSILLVEQYLDFALELADECYVMDKGQIVLHVAVGEAKKEEIQQHMLAS